MRQSDDLMPANRPQRARLASAAPNDQDDISLLEILDHVLNAGVVVQGSIVISVAGVDLVYLGLNLVLTSVETALQHLGDGATSRSNKVPRT